MAKNIIDDIIKTKQTDKHIFLLWGEESFMRTHYKSQLKDIFMPTVMPELNLFTFDGKDYSINDVDNAIEGLPVMDSVRLLIFSDSLIFKTDGRTGAKAEVREYWQKRLKDIPDYVYIIFDEAEIDKRSALYKAVLKDHVACEFSYMDDSTMLRWTVTLFKKLGKEISQEDARYLISICPQGMMFIKREAEKLCAYRAEYPDIRREDIEALVTPKLTDKVFDMISAMLSKKSSDAMAMLNDLLLLKIDPAQIVGALVYNLDKLVCIKLLKKDGADNKSIASKLKLAPFMVTKFYDMCAKYSQEELSYFVKRTAETDMALKSNSIDNAVLIGLLVSELSSK